MKSNLKVRDKVRFRTKYGSKEIYTISSVDDTSEKICLVDDDNADCGVYYPNELRRVSTPEAEEIKCLKAQIKRMQEDMRRKTV